ncbi:uncharacterized protein A1O5_06067 [Cladophialophora psammophila CBS 110553]|uniref:Uncharacterized protein n=1 Tax=Cladophialophora psammophila CBS 110553 TaxID=1182543 RepID=W9XL30_9EURO|nr:uncharacterized protein A1O5_06067 [Cladophialophora psammophila CBS 110553]EXJ71074.1 hypothetical protein A1O5_06067 [Cladophialophora psammophila CBS 110553]
MSPIGVSWALAQTVDGALKISRDAVLVASGDNIQPFTLTVCEKFGATLAISSLTQTKIEDMLRKQAKSPVQKFWAAKIGWAKGDSVDLLSHSVEGIRFLSLAAALVSSCSKFDAATALARMIRDTAEDKALSPSIFQLKDLLDVLEPRLNQSRFLDVVLGYQALLPQLHTRLHDNAAVPSAEAIQKIVDNFRELSRVGPADVRSLKITVGPFAAWVSGFAHWCVEVPPMICDEHGAVILDQPNPQVTICISRNLDYHDNISIETIYDYKSSQEAFGAIVKDADGPAWATGMVTVETYARFLLKDLEFHDGLGRMACAQAIPYAVHLTKSAFTDPTQIYRFTDQEVEPGLLRTVYPSDPFPADDVVGTLVNIFLGPTYDGPLIQRLSGDLKLTDLPAVSLWVEERRNKFPEDPEQAFLGRLGQVVADILALSLLVAEGMTDPKKIDWLVLYNPYGNLAPASYENEWRLAVKSFLQHGVFLRRTQLLGPLIDWALKLIGHQASEYVSKGEWVASSFRGQVIAPRLLFASEIPVSGFACMSVFAGTLMLETEKNRKFSWILSEDEKGSLLPLLNRECSLSARANAFPEAKIRWQLTVKDNHLAIAMGWTFNRSIRRPFCTLNGLMGSVMLGNCSHSADTDLERKQDVVLIAPDNGPHSPETLMVAVYPLYGNEALKMLALASTKSYGDSRSEALKMLAPTSTLSSDDRNLSILINRAACMSCAIRVCLHLGIGGMIL